METKNTHINVTFTNPIIGNSGTSGTSGTSVIIGHMDGGLPDSDYGGINPIDAGGVV